MKIKKSTFYYKSHTSERLISQFVCGTIGIATVVIIAYAFCEGAYLAHDLFFAAPLLLRIAIILSAIFAAVLLSTLLGVALTTMPIPASTTYKVLTIQGGFPGSIRSIHMKTLFQTLGHLKFDSENARKLNRTRMKIFVLDDIADIMDFVTRESITVVADVPPHLVRWFTAVGIKPTSRATRSNILVSLARFISVPLAFYVFT